MGMNVKAIERKIAYLGKEGGKDQYMYVMQPLIYNKLTPEKVIQQAALHCGLTPAVMNVAYAALSEVIKAWATEGHSVAVPGLGTMRFGLRANAVKSVEDVSTKLITQRRVIFSPNMEIKQELAKTGISITCVNRDGEVVKNITSMIYSPTSYSRRVNRLVNFLCVNSKTMYICIYISEEFSNFFKSSLSSRRHNITSNMVFTYFINSNSSFIITNSIFTTITCIKNTIIKPVIQECNSNRIIS